MRSRKALKSFPIGFQLSVLVAIIIVIVLVIVYTNYLKAAEVVEKKNSEYHKEMIAQINRTIAANSDAVKRILLSIAYNPKIVQPYLNEKDPVKKYTQYTQLMSYMADMRNMKDGILDIALIGVDGTTFNLNGDVNNLKPFMDEIPINQFFNFTGVQKMRINNITRDVFIVGSPIYSTIDFGNDKKFGVIMIVLDAKVILGSPPSMDKMGGSKLYALDRNGNVFYSNVNGVKTGTPYTQISSVNSDSSFYMQRGEIPDIGGELVFNLPKSELLRGLEDIRKQSLLILFISLLVLSLPFLLVVNNILMPLKKLMRFMNDFKLGHLRNLNNRISLQGYAEISSMASDFNRMLDEIDMLTRQLVDSNTKLYRAELVKKQSELAFLQSQINPHFLYNTLESIKGMAVEEGSDKIFHMAKALAFVFRYSIKGTDFVTLQEELTLVKSHIHIQQIRFVNRLNVQYRIPEDLLSCKVPKMILQPLVENAIFHGIEPRTGKGGLLEIIVEQFEEMLILSVADNGAGIDQEQLRILKYKLSVILDMTDNQRTNIGLVNVNNRIKLNFGEAYGITISSKRDAGTTVIISLPLGRDDDV
ncbi:sensor histidine kinase [Paenibacillus sp. 2TAB26]|uniref:sensor histidine kinase n=1 Tax=Paenibacillus sp. 2TAB26 TaxID=3233005 RepID=UPI003F9D1A87